MHWNKLPEYMCEECDEEDSDLEWEVQSAIEAADYALQCLRQAQAAMDAIEGLNNELKALLGNRSVQLKAVKFSTAIDMWFDSDFMDCLVHMQINKARKSIRRAIAQVETIRRELERL